MDLNSNDYQRLNFHDIRLILKTWVVSDNIITIITCRTVDLVFFCVKTIHMLWNSGNLFAIFEIFEF